MPDPTANQARGLLGLTGSTGPQLTAMVSHGDDKSELPLLWQLCSSMVDLGYTVTVLDGTKTETDNNPGLMQLLDFRFGAGIDEAEGPGWNIVPAAQGLQSLLELSSKPGLELQRLGDIFAAGSVVVLYTGVAQLVKLLAGSTVRPLLTVSTDKNALVTSYLALKRLLLRGGLEPTILNMMQGPRSGRPGMPGNVANNLSECARNFLGYELNAIPINAPLDTPEVSAQMRRLALRLLENALPLERSSMARSVHAYRASTGLISRSH